MNTTNQYHFNVGALQCIAINDRIEHFPIDTIVKDVSPDELKRALVAEGLSPTENLAYYNGLFVDTGEKRVLIDAGWGKEPRPFGGVNWKGDLVDCLQNEGISPSDIDVLVITHGDADHILGIANSNNELTFPSCTYALTEEAFNYWSNPANAAALPPPLTIFGRKMLPLIQKRIQVVAAGGEFLPGFQLISAPGHRPGHTALWITSEGQHLLHLADTVGHPILMTHPSWHGYADAAHDQAAQDRIRLLTLAASQHALVFGSHLPFPGVGTITSLGEGWHWQPLREASY